MIDDMQIYTANLGKYNEGELVGAWFMLPVDYEEVSERIGLNCEYEEYAIHDYELPFDIEEFTTLEEVNRICEMVQELPEDIQDKLKELQLYFGNIEELYDHADDIILYSDCDDMTDVAYHYMEDTGALNEIPSYLQTYFDYEPFGRDLYLDGNFIETRHGAFQILR